MKITRRETLPLLAASTVVYSTLGQVIGNPLAHAEDLSDLMEPGPLGEHIKGDPNAPVTLIKYASMTCPHCRSWHVNHYPAIKEKYIDTGMVKFYMREFPFDPAAVAAFMLAECSGEAKYFSMIDILYQQQAVWKRGHVRDELFKIAKLAGFTKQSFEACLKNQKLLDDIVAIQKKAASDYEVNSTPTFFINGTKYGNMPADAMGQIFDALV